VAAGQAVLVRRVDREKETLPLGALAGQIADRLDSYQRLLFGRALDFRAQNTHHLDDYDTFRSTLEERGGFLMAHWCGDGECEKQINADTGATIRVVPFESPDEAGRCVRDGQPSERRVVFARAY
jgi:prolyl-tRNA synthetase